MLINLEIILQCMHISNHLIFHSKYVTILFVNYTSMKLKEKNEVLSFYSSYRFWELYAMSWGYPSVLLKDMAWVFISISSSTLHFIAQINWTTFRSPAIFFTLISSWWLLTLQDNLEVFSRKPFLISLLPQHPVLDLTWCLLHWIATDIWTHQGLPWRLRQ